MKVVGDGGSISGVGGFDSNSSGGASAMDTAAL